MVKVGRCNLACSEWAAREDPIDLLLVTSRLRTSQPDQNWKGKWSRPESLLLRRYYLWGGLAGDLKGKLIYLAGLGVTVVSLSREPFSFTLDGPWGKTATASGEATIGRGIQGWLRVPHSVYLSGRNAEV